MTAANIKLTKEETGGLRELLRTFTAEEIIRWASETIGDELSFSSSLGVEDQVIFDMIHRCGADIETFTLDTGRLFNETYELIEKTGKKYGKRIRIFFPDSQKVEEMVRRYGINLFFDGIDQRKLCCSIRKLEPLKRALDGKKAWICGLHRDQSSDRAEVEPITWDSRHGIFKLNPLWNWSTKKIWNYVHEFDVPYNELHERGFPSIGCASCTRAVKPGEDIRAGRWWWEETEHKECGLHWVDGKLVRQSQ